MDGNRPVGVRMNYTAEVSGEFPVIDPRHAMRRYRHTWFSSTDRTNPAVNPGSDWIYNAIVHYDVMSRAVDRYAFSQGYVSEPASATVPEGEG